MAKCVPYRDNSDNSEWYSTSDINAYTCHIRVAPMHAKVAENCIKMWISKFGWFLCALVITVHLFDLVSLGEGSLAICFDLASSHFPLDYCSFQGGSPVFLSGFVWARTSGIQIPICYYWTSVHFIYRKKLTKIR